MDIIKERHGAHKLATILIIASAHMRITCKMSNCSTILPVVIIQQKKMWNTSISVKKNRNFELVLKLNLWHNTDILVIWCVLAACGVGEWKQVNHTHHKTVT